MLFDLNFSGMVCVPTNNEISEISSTKINHQQSSYECTSRLDIKTQPKINITQ
jgi:hypothetical protein